MSLSKPLQIFGVHSVTPYSLVNGEPYGIIRVLKGSSFNFSGELVENSAGSYNFPWGVEDGKQSAELVMKISQFEAFMFEVFFGIAPTEVAADADGTVTTLTNVKGTSLMSATTGIASVAVKAASKTDLKAGKYLVKAAAAATVDVYALSNIDFNRGTDLSFVNDDLKITSSPLSIATSTATEVSGLGVDLTGGSGTIGMTVGDTAIFEIIPVSTKSYSVIIGGKNHKTQEFGAYVAAQKQGQGNIVTIEVFKARAVGFPIVLEEKAWAEAEITAKCYYDEANDGVARIRNITASTPN